VEKNFNSPVKEDMKWYFLIIPLKLALIANLTCVLELPYYISDDKVLNDKISGISSDLSNRLSVISVLDL
jgi:hypothetical protein